LAKEEEEEEEEEIPREVETTQTQITGICMAS
jgi:hypothetical protein